MAPCERSQEEAVIGTETNVKAFGRVLGKLNKIHKKTTAPLKGRCHFYCKLSFLFFGLTHDDFSSVIHVYLNGVAGLEASAQQCF